MHARDRLSDKQQLDRRPLERQRKREWPSPRSALTSAPPLAPQRVQGRALAPGGAAALLDEWEAAKVSGEEVPLGEKAHATAEDAAFLAALGGDAERVPARRGGGRLGMEDGSPARAVVVARRELQRRFREVRRSEWARRRTAELLFAPEDFDAALRTLQLRVCSASSRSLLEALLGSSNEPWPPADEVPQRAGGKRFRREAPRGDALGEWAPVDDGLRAVPYWQLRALSAPRLMAAARARGVHVDERLHDDATAIAAALAPALSRERQVRHGV